MFRITTLTDNLSTAPIEKNWNRLMKLQGVFTNIGINFLNVSEDKQRNRYLTSLLKLYFVLVFWEMDVLATGDQACVAREEHNILPRRSNFVFAKYGEGILGF